MSIIDKYDLKASVQFPIAGTEEVTENLQLAQSTIGEEGIVSGTVTSGGTPLEGATVKIFDVNDNPLFHAITNPQGKYTIPNVIKGSYKITSTKKGYLTPTTVPITVAANRPTVVDFALTVDPDAVLNTLYGRVRQSIVLTPIFDAVINVFSVVGGVETLVVTTHTNTAGQYVATNLPAGSYIVVANKPGFDESRSGLITLTASDLDLLDLTLIANPGTNTGTVSGLISDITTSLPIANAIVALYQVVGTTETIVQLTKTNAGGRYLFGDVSAGEYLVKALSQTTSV